MLKYTIGNDDGIVSPHHPDYTRRTLEVSAGSKSGTKMAINRRAGVKKMLSRDTREKNANHLPPITNSETFGSHQNMTTAFQEQNENYLFQNHLARQKEIRSPYVSLGNRYSDVTTPYILHTQIQNNDSAFKQEHSKPSRNSENILEYKNEHELRYEPTFSSLGKLPTYSGQMNDKPPHGRKKSNSFNEHDLFERTVDTKELAIQSNQVGIYRRADRKSKNIERAKADESSSIRKKIEQFRRWHEEEYREKIIKLKHEVDQQFKAEHDIISRQVGTLQGTPTSKNEISISAEDEKMPSEISQEQMDEGKHSPTKHTSKPRNESARTWKTWRNVNESYAYDDVQKYIKENELMDDEKAVWIRKWVVEVNKAMKEQKHESIL